MGLAGGLSGAAITRAARQDVVLPEVTSVPEAMKGSGEVVLVSFGGAYLDAQRTAYIEPFEQLTGIKVNVAEGPDAAKVKAMVDTGNVEWDVVQLGEGDILRLEGYWDEMDYTLFDTANINPDRLRTNSFDMLPYAQIYAYRTDAFDAAPTNWADYWNVEAFPGPRTMIGGTGGAIPFLEAALIADGVAPAELYPLDIERAYASLSKIRNDIVKFWDTGAVPAQMLTDNEVVMGVAWNGRIAAIQAEGAPVEIVWNEGMLAMDVWASPKGAPHRENAMKLCAFATLPESQARLSSLITYGFINDKAAELIAPERLPVLPTAPEIAAQMFLKSEPWWAEHTQEVLDRWNEWILE
jgi:putative spermidine/putrescine transport system substrate-binding protein